MISDICDKYIQLWKWKKYSNGECIVICIVISTAAVMGAYHVACMRSEVPVIVALLRLVIEDMLHC